MVNYTNSKIYKITCNVTGLTYYGSTVNPLSKRMGEHRSNFKTNRGTCKSKLVLASGDYDYCLVEKWPCADKSELHQRERFYIESNECVNLMIPGRTKKKWEFDNKEKIIEYQKEYRADNKEKITEYKKEWYSENKETISERMKEYSSENKQELKAKRSVKITCECGCSVQKGCIIAHRKTQKHINLMSQLQQSV